MPRAKRPGELGAVSINLHGSQYRARTVIRDGANNAHHLVAHGMTEALARERIEEDAHTIWGGIVALTAPVKTIGELANIWLSELSNRVELGRLRQQSADQYAVTWRTVLEKRVSAIPVESFDAGLVDQLLQSLELEARRTGTHVSAARNARKMLSLIAKTGVRHRIMQTNPVPAAERLASTKPDFEIFTPEQLTVILDLIGQWEGNRGARGGGTYPNRQLLNDMVLVILATSMRPGEALAIRRQDYLMRDGQPAVRLNGTIVEVTGSGVYRQDVPKEARQERGMFIPAFAHDVFKRALLGYKPNEYDLLFRTKNDTPYSVTNLGKLFRSFRSFYDEELRAVGVDPDKFVPRSFRKTSATTLAEYGTIELAQKLLGHSDSAITTKHYIKPDDQVSMEAATIMQQRFGSIAR